MRPLHRSRGLAAAAVAALALTGLAVTVGPSVAAPTIAATDGAADGVTLLVPRNARRLVSTRFDGDRAVPLSALVPADTDSGSVTFSWNPDPAATSGDEGWVDVDGSGPFLASGFAYQSWFADGDVTDGDRVALRVAVTDTDGTTYDVAPNVRYAGPDSEVNAVNLYRDDRTNGGVFTQPYADSGRTASLMAVAGDTSARAGSVEVSWRGADGTFGGTTQAAVRKTELKVSDGEYVRGGRFAGALDLTGQDLGTEPFVVSAERGSDAAAAVTTDPVTIDDLGVVGARRDPGTGLSRVRLRVYGDDDLVPVGAEVMRRDEDGSSGTLVGYTDADGVVVAEQDPDETVAYYVNTTDTDAYEESVDFETSYDSRSSTSSGVYFDSEDGRLFDPDEYDAGDLAVVAYDTRGRAAAGQPVRYRIFPEDADPPATWQSAVTGDDGRALLDFTPPEQDTEYEVQYAATEDENPQGYYVDGIDVAEATLALEPDTAQQLASGRSRTFAGSLTTRYGPLERRRVTLSFTRGTEPTWADGADAGIFRGPGRPTKTDVRVVTEPNGTFRLTVADPVEGGRPSETGGDLAAVSPTTGAATDDVAVDVTQGVVDLPLRLSGEGDGARADRLRVKAPAWAAGLEVDVVRLSAGGADTVLGTVTLDDEGRATLTATDLNGADQTTYVVRHAGSDRTRPATSNELTKR